MKIDENYSISIDSNNVMLNYKSDAYEKMIKGELRSVTTKNTNYFPNVKMALKSYVNKVVDQSASESLNVLELLSKIEVIEDKIDLL